MKLRSLLLVSATLAMLPALASAEPKETWYLDVGGGANWIDDTDGILTSSVGATSTYDLGFDTGWAVATSVGYNWERFRVELEGSYRNNDVDFLNTAAVNASGDIRTAAAMINVLVDLELVNRVSISLGGGVGGAFIDADVDGATALGTASFDDDDFVFAYQGIAGLNIDVGERTELFAEYRYFATDEAELNGSSTPGPVLFAARDFETVNHTAMIGLRYFFGDTQPGFQEPPQSETTTPPQTNFTVMFDFNKANLTAEGQSVVAEAADALKGGAASVTIEASGDGAPAMNQNLAERRGAAVKAALVNLGVAADKITVTTQDGGDATITATQ